MKSYFSSRGITIYHASCEEILPHLQPNSADVVLTDPPYGIAYKAKRKRPTDVPTSIANDDSLNALRASLPLLDRLLRQDRHAYVFAGPVRIGEAVDAVAEFWRVKNLLVWDKGNSGSRGDCIAGYALNWEAIIYASKGRRPLAGPRPRCIYRHDWQAWRDPVHPTVKPVAMMSWLLTKSSAPGELVLDPFMGSGVVLRAAAELGRRAIGIEIEERYCATAARRIEEFQREGREIPAAA